MVHSTGTQAYVFSPIDQLSVLYANVYLVVAFVISIHNFYFSSQFISENAPV